MRSPSRQQGTGGPFAEGSQAPTITEAKIGRLCVGCFWMLRTLLACGEKALHVDIGGCVNELGNPLVGDTK